MLGHNVWTASIACSSNSTSLEAPEARQTREPNAMQSVPGSANECFLSPVRIWEMIMLQKRKGIELDRDCGEWLLQYKQDSNVHEAPSQLGTGARVTLDHSWALRSGGADSGGSKGRWSEPCYSRRIGGSLDSPPPKFPMVRSLRSPRPRPCHLSV